MGIETRLGRRHGNRDPKAGANVAEIVRNRRRFAALSDVWDTLAAQHGTPLALHAWYSAALAALDGERCDLRVVLVWDGNRLAAAAPLVLDKSRLPARLVPIDAFAGEPDRLLYRDPAALADLAQACASLRTPILFRRLSASEDDRSAFSSRLRSGALVSCRPRHASATVGLPDSFEAIEAGMSSSRRSTIRRKWRAATREHGDVRVEFITPAPHDLPAQLARLEAIEGSGWKSRSGTALAADPRMGRFVTHMAEAFAQTGALVLAYLSFGARDAACRLILRGGTTWFEIKIGYDEDFARFSPGVLLMHAVLREACRTGMRSYAFLGIHESWQDHWPRDIVADCRLATYPLSPSGALALLADTRQTAMSSLRAFRD
jgi:CelD/BcsL family acetyltransferase involved in cellulose biosynthesis